MTSRLILAASVLALCGVACLGTDPGNVSSDAGNTDGSVGKDGGADGGGGDAGLPGGDAGPFDGGAGDAGLFDGGAGDSGVLDGSGDGGLADGGESDAGFADGGERDAGVPDGGAGGGGYTFACTNNSTNDPDAPTLTYQTLSDGGSCAGLMPAPPTCWVKLDVSAGRGNDWAYWWNPFAGIGDGAGDVAILGEDTSGNSLDQEAFFYFAGANGYVGERGAQTGEAVPLQHGFLSQRFETDAPLDIYAGDSHYIASIESLGGFTGGNANGILRVLATQHADSSWSFTAQRFDFQGQALSAPVEAGAIPAWGTTHYYGLVDAAGASLVLFAGPDAEPWYARWLAADGTPLTPVFRTTFYSNKHFDFLIGGGIAVSDEYNYGAPNGKTVFTRVLPSASPTDLPAPAWLAALPGRTYGHSDFQATPRSDSYVFISDTDAPSCSVTYSVVAADGTLCGRVSSTAFPTSNCRYRSAEMGLDGTLIEQESNNGNIYRLWPRLFR